VESLLIGAVMGIPEEALSHAHKTETILALNKLLWIQNDLFTRHFVKEGVENIPKKKEIVEDKQASKSWIESMTGVTTSVTIYGAVVLAMGGMLIAQAGKA
jgi:hypothetical protein